MSDAGDPNQQQSNAAVVAVSRDTSERPRAHGPDLLSSSRLSIQGLIDRMRTMQLVAGQASVEELDPERAGADARFAEIAGAWADELASLLPTLQIEQDQTTEEDTRMGTPKAITDDSRTAPTNEAIRTLHRGNVGADMVPFYQYPGQCEPEYDQGHSVVVWYDDFCDLAERKDRLMNALHRVMESATPNERDHPAMWAAWRIAERVIKETKPVSESLPLPPSPEVK